MLLKGCRDRKWSRSHCQMNSAGKWAISGVKGETHETVWKFGRGLRPAPDVLMQIYGSEVSVHVRGPERAVLTAKWDDDETIQSIIRELNFGRYAPDRKGWCGMIKNLNQLKRALRPGMRLEVIGHCRPACIGQLREVTWVNTQGFYTKTLNPPDPRSSMRQTRGAAPSSWWGAARPGNLKMGCVSRTPVANIRRRR